MKSFSILSPRDSEWSPPHWASECTTWVPQHTLCTDLQQITIMTDEYSMKVWVDL